MSLYEDLGLDPNQRYSIDNEDIKKSYRRLLLQLHPDRGANQANTDRLIRVMEAYRILSDPDLRMQYNKTLDETAKYTHADDNIPDYYYQTRAAQFILYLARHIEPPIPWDADIVLSVRLDPAKMNNKFITVEYNTWRHQVTGSVVSFFGEIESKVIRVQPDIDYQEEYLVVEGGGNDVIEGEQVRRGDLLLELNAHAS